jgi:hypothetical protein
VSWGYRVSPGYRWYPEDVPRCPEDTAGVLRCLNREDAPVSSGHRIPRMPSVSHDANLRFQMARRALGHYVVRGTCLRRGRGTSRGSAQLYMCVRDVAPRASKGPLLSNTRPKGPLLSNTRPDSMTRLLR